MYPGSEWPAVDQVSSNDFLSEQPGIVALEERQAELAPGTLVVFSCDQVFSLPVVNPLFQCKHEFLCFNFLLGIIVRDDVFPLRTIIKYLAAMDSAIFLAVVVVVFVWGFFCYGIQHR